MLPKVKAKYTARAIACSFGSTQSTGNYQVGVTVEIDEGDHAGETITWIGFFTDATSERSIESLQHMGWKGDDLSELQDLDAESCKRLLPEQVQIVCDTETYEGELQLKVRWINKPGAGSFSFKNKLDAAHMKSFAAQMKGTIRGMRQGEPRNKQEKHPNAPGNGGGDIPF